MADPIIVVDHDPTWPAEFERLRDRAAAAVGELAVAIEHYVSPTDSEELRAQLAFRDARRANPELAADYEALKRELAERFRDDREAYTEAKTEFVTRASRSSAPASP